MSNNFHPTIIIGPDRKETINNRLKYLENSFIGKELYTLPSLKLLYEKTILKISKSF